MDELQLHYLELQVATVNLVVQPQGPFRTQPVIHSETHSCLCFALPNNVAVTVQHSFDAMVPNWCCVTMEAGTYSTCEDHELLQKG